MVGGSADRNSNDALLVVTKLTLTSSVTSCLTSNLTVDFPKFVSPASHCCSQAVDSSSCLSTFEPRPMLMGVARSGRAVGMRGFLVFD